jgi:anti-anti-sigma factor
MDEYQVDGATMVATGARMDGPEFREACNRLMEADDTALFIDLMSISYMSSSDIGHLVKTYKMATGLGKTLRVRVSREIYNILALMQIHTRVDLEVGDDADGE